MDVKLVMFKSDGQRKDFPVSSSATVLGRGEECDLRIPLLNVSRKHCELQLSPKGVKVKDLASANGTYVNNKRVTEVDLKAGDRLVIGPVVFTIQIDGKPDTIKPVKTRAQQAKPAAAEAASEEVVELEAVGAGGGADDVISALEALAAEKDEDEK
jgi:pSer/pThr/pTyr-binding forkhead associated (FHA) protein